MLPSAFVDGWRSVLHFTRSAIFTLTMIGAGAIAQQLVGSAWAQPAAPRVSTLILTDDLIATYARGLVPRFEAELALRERYGLSLFDPDLNAIDRAGARDEYDAIIAQYPWDEEVELAIAQAQLCFKDPGTWAVAYGDVRPPQQNIDLVAVHLPALEAAERQMVDLVAGEPRTGPVFTIAPYPLTGRLTAAFVAAYPEVAPEIDVVLARYALPELADDPAAFIAAIDAAGALVEIDAILAPWGFNDYRHWLDVQFAILHVVGWVAYTRAGADYSFGAPPPSVENIYAVTPYLEAIDALGFFRIDFF